MVTEISLGFANPFLPAGDFVFCLCVLASVKGDVEPYVRHDVVGHVKIAS